MKKVLAMILAAVMLLSLCAAASADGIDFAAYAPGVTVIADENSPTGYTAVFVFEEASMDEEYQSYIASQYNTVLSEKINMDAIAGVQIYSNCALLFTYDEMEAGMPLDPARCAHDPAEYADGMYPAGGDTSADLFGGAKINYYADMTEFEDGKWGVAFPLTSGATDYNIRLIDADGNTDGTYLCDPANYPMYNTASGVYSRSSMVYVPYDASKSTVDRSIENPKTEGETGTLEFVAFEENNSIAVYTPNGYDAERAEPYNVLYISHGAQSEFLGSEMRWLNECAAVNIMDNLGTDFILVSVNNIHNGGENLEKGSSGLWDQGLIWETQERIMAYVEANYNVGTEPANRAYAGFSMGGLTTNTIYANHADVFGYFGIWSFGMGDLLDGNELVTTVSPKVQIAIGDWDYLVAYADGLIAKMDEMGLAYDLLKVPGSHDWRCWQLIFADAAQNFFFK